MADLKDFFEMKDALERDMVKRLKNTEGLTDRALRLLSGIEKTIDNWTDTLESKIGKTKPEPLKKESNFKKVFLQPKEPEIKKEKPILQIKESKEKDTDLIKLERNLYTNMSTQVDNILTTIENISFKRKDLESLILSFKSFRDQISADDDKSINRLTKIEESLAKLAYLPQGDDLEDGLEKLKKTIKSSSVQLGKDAGKELGLYSSKTSEYLTEIVSKFDKQDKTGSELLSDRIKQREELKNLILNSNILLDELKRGNTLTIKEVNAFTTSIEKSNIKDKKDYTKFLDELVEKTLSPKDFQIEFEKVNKNLHEDLIDVTKQIKKSGVIDFKNLSKQEQVLTDISSLSDNIAQSISLGTYEEKSFDKLIQLLSESKIPKEKIEKVLSGIINLDENSKKFSSGINEISNLAEAQLETFYEENKKNRELSTASNKYLKKLTLSSAMDDFAGMFKGGIGKIGDFLGEQLGVPGIMKVLTTVLTTPALMAPLIAITGIILGSSAIKQLWEDWKEGEKIKKEVKEGVDKSIVKTEENLQTKAEKLKTMGNVAGAERVLRQKGTFVEETSKRDLAKEAAYDYEKDKSIRDFLKDQQKKTEDYVKLQKGNIDQDTLTKPTKIETTVLPEAPIKPELLFAQRMQMNQVVDVLFEQINAIKALSNRPLIVESSAPKTPTRETGIDDLRLAYINSGLSE